MEIFCDDISQLETVAKEILTSYKDKRVFALYGQMGAGKTTITKAFCSILKVSDIVNSPTFAIVNEYFTDDGDSIYHFDCYRLNKINEFIDIGGEDYLYSGNYCFIEWPQIIENFLPTDTVKVNITPSADGKTRIFSTSI
ncbi:MAG: tRNA (adenosine(37)-N6)-threonylcarbamoyltransferase complex ATPase subunit type 1 TsaE [Bacteroidales bacterium]|jgi:tRNA threonylcarbamoyladenosine biosynthesis protein TsaE|nr:tRNA (adenosine(37)-N6)-threonylcarbamoyltransferase complex ATPase subunit type 1 TsaE [Bacteroidales bacterium]MDD2205223.1 tRNA (adenosine(37)-N6)-threonylcarbamoyltransferase complex ATPase subunit type 1 TsaE [Bacteroidales bacterium]MDD3151675.1 tRNA (adenosine(37)-N6)-threonylcarbamoyltransferase complex ATPase subunit type 1 TsaE [Bacteroidales bacterium]MDD3914674.1 tRNA (adenosine(37)-N6)-threonylcarbamoyltransferase complex ATPase subunit type 1 TsaE [Bacteroidales bacterium]MDD46